jgi:hypothetical protein
MSCRFTGTIVGCENLDALWPESSWRYLKVILVCVTFTVAIMVYKVNCALMIASGFQVRWDEPSAIPRPDRVSPWKIEPASSPPVNPLPLSNSRVKRHRQNVPPPSPESLVLTKEGKFIAPSILKSVIKIWLG